MLVSRERMNSIFLEPLEAGLCVSASTLGGCLSALRTSSHFGAAVSWIYAHSSGEEYLFDRGDLSL
jgi:hypothetical protein